MKLLALVLIAAITAAVVLLGWRAIPSLRSRAFLLRSRYGLMLLATRLGPHVRLRRMGSLGPSRWSALGLGRCGCWTRLL